MQSSARIASMPIGILEATAETLGIYYLTAKGAISFCLPKTKLIQKDCLAGQSPSSSKNLFHSIQTRNKCDLKVCDSRTVQKKGQDQIPPTMIKIRKG